MRREELETAATSYVHLRGLLAVPLGVLLVLAALGNWQVGVLRHEWVFVGCLAVAMAVAFAISRFYRRQYGQVTSTAPDRRKAIAATVFTAVFVLAGSLVARSEASFSLDLPVNGLAATMAAGLLTYHRLTVAATHHTVVWGAVLLAGVLPVWGGLGLDDTHNVGLVMVGVAAIVSGLLDHRLMHRRVAAARGFGFRTDGVG